MKNNYKEMYDELVIGMMSDMMGFLNVALKQDVNTDFVIQIKEIEELDYPLRGFVTGRMHITYALLHDNLEYIKKELPYEYAQVVPLKPIYEAVLKALIKEKYIKQLYPEKQIDKDEK